MSTRSSKEVKTEKPDRADKVDKIVLEFKYERDTKRARLFQEELGEQAWSDQDVAIGPLYVKMQALQLIGSPNRIKVTIEPLE